MADEITIQFAVTGQPDAVRTYWRSEPPNFLNENGYRMVDESYDSLVFSRTNRLAGIVSWGMSKTTARLAINFRVDGTFTKITVTGQAPERAREQIAEYAASCGGGHDPRMTRFLLARGYAV